MERKLKKSLCSECWKAQASGYTPCYSVFQFSPGLVDVADCRLQLLETLFPPPDWAHRQCSQRSPFSSQGPHISPRAPGTWRAPTPSTKSLLPVVESCFAMRKGQEGPLGLQTQPWGWAQNSVACRDAPPNTCFRVLVGFHFPPTWREIHPPLSKFNLRCHHPQNKFLLLRSQR